MHFEPGSRSAGEVYAWMVGLITPRPIAWVSSVSSAGRVNLAPYSFFNGVGANPPTVVFCPANRRDGTAKDTLANIRSTGQFVVNVVTESMAKAMNQTSAECDHEVDEFELAGLAKLPSVRVAPPRVVGCKAALECELHSAIQLGSGPGGANLVIGRIVMMHIDDALLDERGRLVGDRLDTIGRMGGSDYVRTGDRFELPRPESK